jgi:uncharacterized membrane protein
MKKNIIFIAVFVLGFLKLWSDNVEFHATVDKNPVTVGERFTVTFSVNGDASNFKGPNFKGFTVLGGPMQSQNVQIINGAMSRSLSYSYILTADKTGNFNIDPATISSGGNAVKSNSIQMRVLPESDTQKQRREQQADQEKSLGKQALEILKKNIFVKANVTKRSVYQGEQITATYKLYLNPQLNPIEMKPKKIPSFDGFWTQEINVDKLNWTREVINGVAFNSAVIKQVVLFPQRNGNLTVDPYEFDFVVRMKVDNRKRSNDMFNSFFDDPFFGGSYRDFPYTAKSESISINVNNLPGGSPADFNGAVGNFSLDSWLDKNKTKAGDPISLSIKITGSGNMKLLGPLKSKFPPGFEAYEPKVIDNTNVTISGISGNITYEYLAIPRNAGTFKIEPIVFVFFDLNKKQYISLKSKEFSVTVEKGDGSNTNNIVSGVRKEEVELIGKDIRFIKMNSGQLKQFPKSFFNSPLFWLISILPLIFFFFFIFWRRKKNKYENDLQLFKNRKATKFAKKRLSAAKGYLNKSQHDKFYEEINRALWGYLSDKLGIPNSELTKDKARDVLLLRDVSSDLIEKFMETLDEAEFARYAPSSVQGSMSTVYKDAVNVITEMEGVLK